MNNTLQDLRQVLDTTWSRQASIEALREFHSRTAYCEDAQGNLIGLVLSGTDLETLHIPKAWNTLQYLNLSDNKKLHSLIFESSMPFLAHLDVSDSGLEVLKLPAGFEQLKWLDVSRNALRSFVPVGDFPVLHYLDLSGNALNEFKSAWIKKFPKLQGLYLKENPFGSELNFTQLHANSLEAMRQFQDGIERSGSAENKEFKVLLVGNGGVGKSCLVERLVFKTFQQRHLSTHGIALEQYNEADFPYVLNLWDFGGQDIYHATHRLFLQSNAIYLLLWDENTLKQASSVFNENGTERHYDNHDLFYWLDYINLEGKKSPVIIIKTKVQKDGEEDHPERPQLKKDCETKFPYFNFINIDSSVEVDEQKNGLGFDDLKHELKKAIQQVYKSGVMPQSWAVLRQRLRDKQKAGQKSVQELLTLKEYLDLAEDLALGQPPMQVLAEWLVQSGVVFYKKGYMNNAVILDQAWAIKAIYTLFKREGETVFGSPYYWLQQQKGQFTGADLAKIWATYGSAERALFVNFMLSCELCFEVTEKKEDKYPTFEERVFVAPQLLTEQVPIGAIKYFRQNRQLLHVKYQHRRLHSGVIQRFIVRTHTYAKYDEIWRNGILIEEDGIGALISVEKREERNQSFIHVEVPQQGLKLLAKIQNLNLLNELQSSFVEEWVSLDGKTYVSKQKLQDKNDTQPYIVAEDGQIKAKKDFAIFLDSYPQEQFKSSTASIETDNTDLIAQMRAEKANPTKHPIPMSKPKVFVSYAHKADSRYFKLFVEGIKAHSNWDIFDDRHILIGEDWHERLQTEVQRCDFAIFLLSPYFVKSDYIQQHEFEQFVQRNVNTGFPFFSVLLTDCNYSDWETISKRQLFVARGEDYDLSRSHRDQQISFDLLARFDMREGEIIPNPYLNTFYKNFVEAVNKALKGK